jgi:hypothetical protein
MGSSASFFFQKYHYSIWNTPELSLF